LAGFTSHNIMDQFCFRYPVWFSLLSVFMASINTYSAFKVKSDNILLWVIYYSSCRKSV